MPATNSNKARPVQMVVWTHDSRIDEEEVVVDKSLIPNAKEGDIAEIRSLGKKPFKLYFIVKKKDVSKMPGVQISMQPQLLNMLDISTRSTVEVRLKDSKSVSADTVEFIFKDVYMTRADMWRTSISCVGQCLYSGQKISYLGSVRMSVTGLYKDGKRIISAYVSENTKIVYRSAAARSIFLIQMSAEMWNFEENSEVVFHKLVNSFLPEVFKRWRDEDAHHVVTIVLFSSVDLSSMSTKLGRGEQCKEKQDYFKVVVDQERVSRWNDIMAKLRYEFETFQKDVLLAKDGVIRGTILPAVKGNVLEAITLATSMISSKFHDRDLRRTNVEVIVVTPGSGIFDVDYELFNQTSMKLLSIEIGIDIACLSRPPLHITPLFRFIKDGVVVNALPSWLDISFWNSRERHSQQWIPQCKIYKIQMMGLMENDLSTISIDYLVKNVKEKSFSKYMDDYDSNIYMSKLAISNQRLIDEAMNSASSSALLRPRVSTVELPKYAPTVSTISTAAPVNSEVFSPETITAEITSHSNISDSATLLASTVKNPKKISTLTSLLLGRRVRSDESSQPPSPSLSAQSRQASEVDGRNVETSRVDSGRVQGGLVERSSRINDGPSGTNSTSSDNPSNTNGTDNSKGITTAKYTPSTTAVSTSVSPATIPSPVIPSPGSNNQLSPSNLLFTSSKTNLQERNRFRNDFMPSTSPRYSDYLSRKQYPLSNMESANNSPPKQLTKNEIIGDLDANNQAWVTVENPSKVDKILDISNYGRWQNVFPKASKRQKVKWRSIISPASLPLSSSIFPSWDEFHNNFNLKNYDVTIDPSKEAQMTMNILLEEMLALRLHIGFQLVTGRRVHEIESRMRPDSDCSKIVQIIPKDCRGSRVYMTRANEIHRLVCDYDGTKVNVQCYSRPVLISPSLSKDYSCFVKGKFDTEYHKTLGDFFDPGLRTINWNSLDQFIAGFEDVADIDRLFKVRFVVIPSDTRNTSGTAGEERLTLEELRVDGVRKIGMALHKNSIREMSSKTKERKDIKTPEIIFYTGELNTYIQQMIASEGAPVKVLSERFDRSVRIQQLATELQASDSGIVLSDRKWHRKLHRNCFIGHEFVSWLIENFTDISTPEEAIEYGNQLMTKGLFHHVEDRHSFLDGHYFYQVNAEYIVKDHLQEDKSKPGWFKKSSSSAESTPELLPMTRNHSAKGSIGVNEVDIDNIGAKSTSSAATDRPPVKKAYVTMALKVDVDPQNRSKREEIVTVHVDRLHNPDNGYHLRFEWFNTTPKLIDELIVGLSRIADSHALKLVQMPIEEVSAMPFNNPFCSVVRTSFCLSPYDLVIRPEENPLTEDPFYYHTYFLSMMGFCKDITAASQWISKDLDILCSWGRQFYNYTQFVHQSGTVLCQIVDNNDFLLMTNSLHVSRISVGSNFSSSVNNTTPLQNPVGKSPQSSAVSETSNSPKSMSDADKIQMTFEKWCNDETELRNMFNKAQMEWTAAGGSKQ